MIMQDNEKKPALRFKGFTDPWEQRKLTEFANFFSGLTYTPNDIREIGVLVLRSSNVINGEIVDADNVYVNPEVVNSENVKEGDIVVVVRNGSRSLIGKHAKIKRFMPDTVIGAFMTGIRSECPAFTNALLNTPHFDEEVSMNMGATINQITGYMFSKMEFRVPTVDEQRQLGAFFENLDTLITLHQRKYEKLVNIKKSMLDKMFPQNGASVPEIRFKGFTDPWEQRKVGTLIEDYTEKTVTQNQYPVLTSSQQQGIVLQEDYFADRQVTTDNNVGYYVLPKGYFTYRSRSDTDVFVFNRNNIVDKGIISYYYPVFAPKSCDSNFLLRRLNHGIKKQLSMAAEGTGQKVLAHAKFKNMVVDVPSQSEQEKIGTILEELDALITLHQRKLEKLQNIKKSCLEKMFV